MKFLPGLKFGRTHKNHRYYQSRNSSHCYPHVDSNVTSFLTGNIDDFYVFDRILTQAEISFLYNLQQGREQVPRLEAVVDAVGSIILIDNGRYQLI